MKRMFVVDDEPIMADFLTEAGKQMGYAVTQVGSVRDACEKLSNGFDVAFIDIRLPDGDGLTVLSEIRSRQPRCKVCMITAYGTVDTAVSAMRLGADDLLQKPFSVTDVEKFLKRLDEPPRPSGDETLDDTDIVTADSKMKDVLDLAGRVAPTDAGILVTGESGTGKELIARHLHRRSHRSDNPFVAVNCSAIPENLLEAELFGYERGAFTGAERRKLGLVEVAAGGTLFLDEIAELPLTLQPKLLRVLEGGEFRRVGGQETLHADIRVVAATNKNLMDLVKKGQFRDDLYYRLSVIPIEIPPLRARPGDIELLARFFLREYSERYGKKIETFSDAVFDEFRKYPWPGNVRELENVIQRAVALTDGSVISVSPFGGVPSSPTGLSAASDLSSGKSFDELTEDYERRLIVDAMKRAAGSQTDAAYILGIKRTTLVMKMKKFGMTGESAGE